MKNRKTQRGFDLIEFIDRYDKSCSLQKSSLAFEDCVWLGCNGNNRMHLTQEHVKELLPYLQKFIEMGEIQ